MKYKLTKVKGAYWIARDQFGIVRASANNLTNLKRILIKLSDEKSN